MLLLVTAYHSFAGEVEASNTPTIRRLNPSRRHQLQVIALLRREEINEAIDAVPETVRKKSETVKRIGKRQTRSSRRHKYRGIRICRTRVTVSSDHAYPAAVGDRGMVNSDWCESALIMAT
jgi:ribosomal protein L22